MELKIFGQKCIADSSQEVKEWIECCEYIAEHIDYDIIMGHCASDFCSFYNDSSEYYDSTFILSNLFCWLAKKLEPEATSIRQTLLNHSVEDTAWTTQRNKDYNDIYYRKLRLSDAAKEIMRTEAEKNLTLTRSLYADLRAKEEEARRQIEFEKGKFTCIDIFKKKMPHGGEEGCDGYIDALYKNNSTGETLRFVERDVFDFGRFIYPKRLEGSEVGDVETFLKSLTEEEKELRCWIVQFGALPDIRM